MSGNDESQISSAVFGSMKPKATMCGEVFPAASLSRAFRESLSCWASLLKLSKSLLRNQQSLKLSAESEAGVSWTF